MSISQTYNHFKLGLKKVDQYTGGKWLIHGTKHRKDNQFKAWDYKIYDQLMVNSFCVFIHILPVVSSTCFVIDYTLIPHNSNEGTETAKGLCIPMVVKIANINIHMEVSMTHNMCACYYIYLSNNQKTKSCGY